MVRAFAHGAMGRRIDPSWYGPIGLFLVPGTGRACHRLEEITGRRLQHGAV